MAINTDIVRDGPILFAYTFMSRLTLDEMQQRLNTGSPWEWKAGDSDLKGSYIWASLKARVASLQLFEEQGRYVMNVRFDDEDSPRAQSQKDWDAIHAQVKNTNLLLLDPTDLRVESDYE